MQKAREWINETMGDNTITFHDNKHPFFDIYHFGFEAAKRTLSEISCYYKDIDGNFIEQFQSLNGLYARIWDLP